jgi:enamine deaminase RidA (YjgF/YER057c/UK114 family)
VGNQVFIAGTAPIEPDGGLAAMGDPEGQARRCWEIILDALAQCGGSPEHIVRTRTYLRHSRDWELVGKVHGEIFGEIRPASTMVVCDLLDPNWLVEIEADAVLP